MRMFRYAGVIPALDGDDFLVARHPGLLLGGDDDTGPTVRETPSDPLPHGKDVDEPQVLPALADDDFVLGKSADVPLVLPSVGEFGGDLFANDLFTAATHRANYMTTLGEDGSLLGPTDDFGLNDHGGWLF